MKQLFFLFSALVLLFACEDNNVANEVDKTVALKNVEFSYDSTSTAVNLPEGALSGKSFGELFSEDSSKYANLENYGISFSVSMNANNNSSKAEDAEFDGMDIDMIFNSINASPVKAVAEPFLIEKGTEESVLALSSINLLTHKEVGKYIFQQMVSGEDLYTDLTPILYYDFGIEGSFPLVTFHQDIPTRATPEMKEFLQGLLNSGLLDE